ncbi:hypothetical protein AAY473_015997 [Plecturocebus cupreus]
MVGGQTPLTKSIVPICWSFSYSILKVTAWHWVLSACSSIQLPVCPPERGCCQLGAPLPQQLGLRALSLERPLWEKLRSGESCPPTPWRQLVKPKEPSMPVAELGVELSVPVPSGPSVEPRCPPDTWTRGGAQLSTQSPPAPGLEPQCPHAH